MKENDLFQKKKKTTSHYNTI